MRGDRRHSVGRGAQVVVRLRGLIAPRDSRSWRRAGARRNSCRPRVQLKPRTAISPLSGSRRASNTSIPGIGHVKAKSWAVGEEFHRIVESAPISPRYRSRPQRGDRAVIRASGTTKAPPHAHGMVRNGCFGMFVWFSACSIWFLPLPETYF